MSLSSETHTTQKVFIKRKRKHQCWKMFTQGLRVVSNFKCYQRHGLVLILLRIIRLTMSEVRSDLCQQLERRPSHLDEKKDKNLLCSACLFICLGRAFDSLKKLVSTETLNCMIRISSSQTYARLRGIQFYIRGSQRTATCVIEYRVSW